MIVGEESYFLPRQLWCGFIRWIPFRWHTISPLQNEIEFVILLLTALFAFASKPFSITLLPAWMTFIILHVVRGETRWQMSLCYLSFVAVIMSVWLTDMTSTSDYPWWAYRSCAVASVGTALLVCIVPMIPPIRPEHFATFNNDKSPRYPVGVQEAALINHDPRDCDYDITHTSQGSGSIVRVKMFYPTTTTAVARAQGLVTWDNDSGLRFNASVAVLSLALLATTFLQVPREACLPLWILAGLHGLGLLCEIFLAGASSPYMAEINVSSGEVDCILKGVASFGNTPSFLFSHMQRMKVCCVEDAPVAPSPSLQCSQQHLDRGIVDKDDRVDNAMAMISDHSTKKDGMDNHIKNNSNNHNDDNVTTLSNKGWPVIVMCHGLGGTRSLYSQLCITLASRGFFVICPEFADGTAACTILPKGSQLRVPGESIPLGVTGEENNGIVKRAYRPVPKGVDVNSQEAVMYRRAQLERRMRELVVVMQYLQRLNLYNTPSTNTPPTVYQTASPPPSNHSSNHPTATNDQNDSNRGSNGGLEVLADNVRSIVYRWDNHSDHDSGDDNHVNGDVDGCEVRWIRETDPTGNSAVTTTAITASISSEKRSSKETKSQDDTAIYSDFLSSLKSSSVSSKVSFIGHSFGGATLIHLATSDLPSATALRHMLTATTPTGAFIAGDSNATGNTTTLHGNGNTAVENISTQVAGMVLLDPWMFPCDTDCFEEEGHAHGKKDNVLQTAPAVAVSTGNVSPVNVAGGATVGSAITPTSRDVVGIGPAPNAVGDDDSTKGTALSTMIDWLSQAALLPLSATLALTNRNDATSASSTLTPIRCAKLTHRSIPSSSPSSPSTLFSSSDPTNNTITSLPSPSCCPFLVIHGDWQWTENNTREHAFVRSVEKGRVLHLKVTDSGHHSYSDIGMLAPPIFAGLGMGGRQDPVVVHAQLAETVCSFLSAATTTIATTTSTSTTDDAGITRFEDPAVEAAKVTAKQFSSFHEIATIVTATSDLSKTITTTGDRQTKEVSVGGVVDGNEKEEVEGVEKTYR